MLRGHMNRSIVVVLVTIGALVASAAVALAHSTPYSWPVSKARVTLQEGTNIALPADQRAALDAELAAWLAKFGPLKLTAEAGAQLGQDPTPGRLAQTYSSYIERLKKIRVSVNSGLSIDSAQCAGQGKALIGKFTEKPGPIEKRYKHFRCNATSYVLEIPDIELTPGTDPSLPEVAEGPRRLIGPLGAVFSVHVTGKSRMLSQRVG
jgi:hypothetical protein